jgi:hypothetical protein
MTGEPGVSKLMNLSKKQNLQRRHGGTDMYLQLDNRVM